MNIFELFGLEAQYDIDLGILNDNYRNLQKEFHPDRFANSSDNERKKALLESSKLNDAFNILKDPVRRAEALIEILSSQMVDKDRASNHDLDFLMKQMSYREQLETIEQNQDSCELFEFQDSIAEENKALVIALQESFNNKDYETSLAIVDKMRFMKKLIIETERVEEALISGDF